MESVFQIFNQFWHGFNSLAPSKRIMVIVTTILSIVVMCAFIFLMNQKEYGILFSELSTDDAGKIIARLQEKKVTYKLSSAGDSILVPSTKVSELRLELASAGLPQGGAVGFEIFDKKSFGVTDFVQQLNYQRALQGELARTINNLDEVQASRVHIVMPKKSLFIENETQPTASVFVKLKSGRKLGTTQVDGIVHLVASSIEELEPENVMIVDSTGRMLSKQQPGSSISKRTTSQNEYQRSVEKELANSIQSMLARVVGDDRALARVSATVDFRVMEKTEEIYDSEEPAVRSRHKKTERSGKPPAGGGQSTVAPIKINSGRGYETNHERLDEVVNYEINRTINKTVMPVGNITKLSVAVLVDGIYHKNDKGMEEYQPRPKKEMKSIEDLVKKAIGFDAKRGDQVVVTSVPFKRVTPELAMSEGGSWKSKISLFIPVLKYIISFAAIVFVVMFILRPVVRSLVERGGDDEAVRARAILASTRGGDQQLDMGSVAALSLEGPPGPGSEEIVAVKNLADNDAKGFAEVMRNWLK